MSLRPNRASGSAPPPPPAYGGYSGGYSAGGSSYYQQPQQPQQPHYQPNYHAGGYGAPGGGAGGGYNAGYNGSSHSNSSYGGYGGGSPIYSPPAATVPTQSTFKDKPTKRAKNGSGGGNMPALVAAIVAFLFLVSTLHYRGKLNSILTAIKVDSAAEVLEKFQTNADELRDLAREKQSLSKTERRWSNRVTSLEKEIASLEEQLKNAHIEHEKIHEEFAYHREAIDEHTEKMASRDNAWRTSAEILQAYTKRESRRVAEERFGLGPHHVRFSVVLPSDPEHTVRYFVVECAPLDLMPHAVHLFLEQVMHGLWNNAWFYLNGPHVLQGGPQAEEGEIEERGRALQRFKDLGLDTLAFPEYSEQFPHVQYTLGFTGRPGGPDFYINKMDNTQAHGPGGQHQHDLEEYADSCFAKVVDGFDTLEMVYREQTFPNDHEWGWFYTRPVHIVGAILLEQTPPPFPAMMDGDPNDPFKNNISEDSHRVKLTHLEHQVEP